MVHGYTTTWLAQSSLPTYSGQATKNHIQDNFLSRDNHGLAS